MSIFIEAYDHTRMMGLGFDSTEEIKEYFNEYPENEIVIDHREVDGIVCLLDDMYIEKQIEIMEEMENWETHQIFFVNEVKRLHNDTLENCIRTVYEGYKMEADSKLEAFQEFYEETNFDMINEVPEPLRYYIDWEQLLHDRETDTWEIISYGTQYLFIPK